MDVEYSLCYENKSLIYNHFDQESKDYLSHHYWDSCYKNEDKLLHLVLLNKANCMKKLAVKCLNDTVKSINDTCIKELKSLSNVIINKSNEFYSKNPMCANIPLWKILKEQLMFDYNIVLDIEYLPKNVQLVKEVVTHIHKTVPEINERISIIGSSISTLNTIITNLQPSNNTLVSTTKELINKSAPETINISTIELVQPINYIKEKVDIKSNNDTIKYDTFVFNSIRDIVTSVENIDKNIDMVDNIIFISSKNNNITHND